MNLDPDALNTGLTALSAAVSLRSTIEKVLGPTADYLGEGLRDYSKKRVENVTKIFERAEKKLEEKGSPMGSVPPRVVKEIVAAGSFTEDTVTAEYFAGVLANSKSGVTRDDRGASIARHISSLTSYEIRSHYVLYSLFRLVFENDAINLALSGGPNAVLYLPFECMAKGLAIEPGEDLGQILPHVFFGLNQHGLIGQFAYGDPKTINDSFHREVVENSGIVVTPTPRGAELFLWALSASSVSPADFFTVTLPSDGSPEVVVSPGFRKVNERKPVEAIENLPKV